MEQLLDKFRSQAYHLESCMFMKKSSIRIHHEMQILTRIKSYHHRFNSDSEYHVVILVHLCLATVEVRALDKK